MQHSVLRGWGSGATLGRSCSVGVDVPPANVGARPVFRTLDTSNYERHATIAPDTKLPMRVAPRAAGDLCIFCQEGWC
jgi:hypothetical protein